MYAFSEIITTFWGRFMILHLQELAKQGAQGAVVFVEERLPVFISEPCKLQVKYRVRSEMDFYLIDLQVSGHIHCNCQRCLQDYDYDFDQTSTIAVCTSEERASELQDHYECIVVPQNQVQLTELVTDELHLYAPEQHPNIEDCQGDVMAFLSES